MLVLSLDLATATGWAFGDTTEGQPVFGTYRMPSTGEDIGKFGEAFEEWLDASLDVHNPDLVIFEAPILSSGRTTPATARKLMGLAWSTEVRCRRKHRRCREANLMTVKKDIAGNGRADKDQMVETARRYGWQVRDDNQADALCLWLYALRVYAPRDAHRFGLIAMGARG